MRPLDDTASTKMYAGGIHFRVGLEANDRHEIMHHWTCFRVKLKA